MPSMPATKTHIAMPLDGSRPLHQKRTLQAVTYRWVGLPLGDEALGFGDLVGGHILGNELLGVTGVGTAMVGSYGVPLVSLDVVLLN